MTPRPPHVVGLHRRAGTSTVAAGLHALDDGICCGSWARAADIVVCGSDAAALALAEALVLAPAGPRPVLAVTTCAAIPPRPRLRPLEERFAAVVLLPDVARWHGLVRPLDEVGTLLAQPVEHLPRPMRSYTSALRLLAAAVLRSGQLGRPVPPLVGAPVPQHVRQPAQVRPEPRVDAGAGVRPVLLSAPRPVRPIRLADLSASGRVALPGRVAPAVDPALDLDDEALEAATCVAAGQVG